MQVRLYLTPEGAEHLAKGGTDLYSWHIVTRPEGQVAPLSTYTFLTEVQVTLPGAQECVKAALANLRKEEQDLQARTYKEVMELRERQENLLSLTYTPATPLNGDSGGTGEKTDQLIDDTRDDHFPF